MATLRTQGKWTAGNLHFRDENLSPENSLWETCPLQAIASDPTLAFSYYNDFFTYTTGEEGLASTLTNSGTSGVIAASGAAPTGVLQIEASDGSAADNDEAYVGSESTVWILGSGKDIWFESRVKFTEANTDDANIIVGLSSLYNANILQDAGGGPAADYDGIVFFKVDGGTVWQAQCSQSTNQTILTDVQSRTSGSWTDLGFHVSSTGTVDYYINGIQVSTIDTNLPTAAMGLLVGAKNGDTNLETLFVDYIKVVQLR